MEIDLPAAWFKGFAPRRGGRPAPRHKPDPDRGARLMHEAKAEIEARLEHPDSDPALVAEGRAYLDDPAAGSPLGAAVVAAAALRHSGALERWPIGELWFAQRGAAFAAEAAVLTATIDPGGYWNRGHGHVPPRLAHAAGWVSFYEWTALARRVRAQLAAAADDAYAAAAAVLRPLRHPRAHWAPTTSFLMPTERSWVDEDCAAQLDPFAAQLLWQSVSTPEQLALIVPHLSGAALAADPAALATAADGVGAALVPHAAAWLDTAEPSTDGRRRLLDLLARIPTDEAFAALVARLDQPHVPLAALEAGRRDPHRALRLLAAAADRPAARELLRVHVLGNRDLAAAELPGLPAPARARVEAVLADATGVPDAPPEALPAVLVTPPWTGPAPGPVVVPGLAFTGAPEIVWRPGERDEWAARRAAYSPWWALETSIEAAAEQYAAGELKPHHEVTLMITAPPALAESLLPQWRPRRVWDSPHWMPQLIARYGLLALPAALHVARADADTVGLLLPFVSAEVAEVMAGEPVRLKSLRPLATAWFDRHPAYAARALTPAALGAPGPARRAAEEALRLAAATHRDEVLAAGAEHGPAARAGLAALLGADPLRQLPAKIPPLPDWADPALLPRILLADRSAALGDGPTRHLCTMLAMSRPGEVYAGVPLVRDLCDRGSLAEFAWSLFQRWQSVGAPAKEAWPLQALRWTGDDETVRRLAPVIRAWPGESGHAKAVTGLDILAEIGTDEALRALNGIAQRSKFKALKEGAAARITAVADALGLTPDQLADRLVPDLGLDPSGTLLLDYGPRRFVVGFDEQLRPFVSDESGARRKDLPKPGARDDGELAPAAHQRYAALKRDARTLAADQLHRLESAMLTQRRWTAAEFRDLIVAHPLLSHIARRLVWLAHLPAVAAFRVAEDRSFADAHDDAFALPPEATVAVAHPLQLGADLPAWSELFADYELLQPFPQLSRPVHILTEPERTATDLTRFAGLSVPTTTLLGLERRGWHRSAPQDAGIQHSMWRPTADGRAVVIDLDPGIAIGALAVLPDQRITHVTVTAAFATAHARAPRTPGPDRTFGSLDPITASELLRDLTDTLTP